MARTNNLTNFLTDVATAIKNKKGDSTPILASNFDTEIENLPSGGSKYSPSWLSFRRYQGTSLDDMINSSSLDVSNITSMYDMFSECSNITSLNITRFSKIKPTDMTGVFYNCTKLVQIIGIEDLDVSKCGKFESTFYNCRSYKVSNSLDLSNWNFSSVNDTTVGAFHQFFYQCSNLTDLNINFSTVRAFNSLKLSFARCFFNCSRLKNINLHKFNLQRGVSGCVFNEMFRFCSELTSLDLSELKPSTSNEQDEVLNMFFGCHSLEHLDMRSYDFTKTINYSSMFNGVPDNCEIIVADDTQKQWFATKFSRLTNVKTITEYEI